MHPTELEGTHTAPPRQLELIPLASEMLERVGDVSRAVATLARGLARKNVLTATASGETSGAGAVVIPIYQAPAGLSVTVERVVIEAAGFTAAVPYANAAAHVELYVGSGPSDPFAQGGLLDFLPAAAGGPVFPGLFTDNYASAIRDGQYLMLSVVGGAPLASTRITARMQGVLETK